MNIQIEKIMGEITKIEKKNFISAKPYLSKKEKCFTDFVDYDNIKYLNAGEINNIKSNILFRLGLLTNVDDPLKVYKVLYDKLRNVNSYESFNDLLHYMNIGINTILESRPKNYDNIIDTNKQFRDYYNKYKELIISIITKKVVYSYFELILENLPTRNINKYYQMINIDGNLNAVLESLNIHFGEIEEKNGIKLLSKKIIYELIFNIYDKRKKHLCGDCECAYDFSCPKVQNKIKKHISKYPFINSGFQVFNKNGDMKRFVVTDCLCYRTIQEKRKSYEELRDIARTKESIFLAYYDAENMTEARMIQNTTQNKVKTRVYNRA